MGRHFAFGSNPEFYLGFSRLNTQNHAGDSLSGTNCAFNSSADPNCRFQSMKLFTHSIVPEIDRKHTRWGIKVMLAAALWLSVISICMICIIGYSNTPGSGGITPDRWPTKSRIALDSKLPTLIMFAHPRCPCTLASIDELDQLMANCQGRLSAQVWFIKLDGTTRSWVDTDLWRKASAIPGVRVYRDDSGVESRRFRAETSGQTVLYGPDGQLLFHGGITVSRGHAGDNPGLDAVEALINHQSFALAQTPVFGCPLFTASANRNQGGSILSQCKQ